MTIASRYKDLGRTLAAASNDLPRARRHWDETAPGMRARSYEPATANGHTHARDDDDVLRPTVSDPTGDGALEDLAGKAGRDRVQADRLVRQIDEHLGATLSLAKALASIAHEWAVEVPATAQELAELERQADLGCEIVARCKRSSGQRYWEPSERTTDVGGLLDRPYRLGSWARQFVRRNGRLPTDSETAAHCEGRRVKVDA